MDYINISEPLFQQPAILSRQKISPVQLTRGYK